MSSAGASLLTLEGSMTTAEFLQGELERLFELESMMALSSDLLGIPPAELPGTKAKGTFARALVEHCVTQGALSALADAIQLSGKGPSELADDALVSDDE